jgi:transposase
MSQKSSVTQLPQCVPRALTLDSRELEELTGRRSTPQGRARRARIVLLSSEGLENKEIARQLGATEDTVGKWRRRFAERRVDGLHDEPRPGTPRQIGDDEIAEVNQVERFFALLTEKQIRRGVHRSTRELEEAVLSYLDKVNSNPKPFRWTKSADDILASIKRFCLRTIEVAEIQKQIIGTSESGH